MDTDERIYDAYRICPQTRGFLVECTYSVARSPDHESYKYSRTESHTDYFAFSTMAEVSEFLGEEDKRRG